ncbi:hypothetical protein OESDEN_16406 [Oesophagostomum dentatum]|uniref:Rad21/Rec8-like protein C-terminal eukaryotic domain-containing protein n=1 Tax=Oesophagostomum dentatum TaxID=61180 RepID=A0A0B1SK23_OESDE|nr:hypothetical protein OESDEN_16406 [Oesophagostomum dentatum]
MQGDYSSLLRNKEELRISVDKHPSVRELLLPYPAYAGKRFPTECIALYHSRFSDNLTYEQALRENIYDPIYRGPAASLWRYSGSEQSSKEVCFHARILCPHEPPVFAELGIRSTAWNRVPTGNSREVCECALMRKAKSLHLAMKEAGDPIRLREVPTAEAGQGDVPGRDQSLPPDFSLPPLPPDIAALAADVTLPQEPEHIRESRSSYLEQARRMTRGTEDMGMKQNIREISQILTWALEGRPSSVQLYDPLQQGDYAQLSMSSASESSACSANRPVPLSPLIPCAKTSKKQAAAVFATLLALAGKQVVDVQQRQPYGEIWFNLRSPSTSSDHDTDPVVSRGSIIS